jgi:hypothetical protein
MRASESGRQPSRSIQVTNTVPTHGDAPDLLARARRYLAVLVSLSARARTRKPFPFELAVPIMGFVTFASLSPHPALISLCF